MRKVRNELHMNEDVFKDERKQINKAIRQTAKEHLRNISHKVMEATERTVDREIKRVNKARRSGKLFAEVDF